MSDNQRGEPSEGMLCGKGEAGLLPSGAPFPSEVLELSSDLEPGTPFDPSMLDDGAEGAATAEEARRQQQKPPAAMRLAPLHNPPPLSADCTAPRHKGGCGAATACCADNSVQLMNSVEQKTPHSKDGSILAASDNIYEEFSSLILT